MSLLVADERSLLEGMVDRQRSEMAKILENLAESDARRRLVPSLTTPLGLVKHATFVEKVWFHSRVAGVPRADIGIPDAVDDSFVLEPSDTVDTVREGFPRCVPTVSDHRRRSRPRRDVPLARG